MKCSRHRSFPLRPSTAPRALRLHVALYLTPDLPGTRTETPTVNDPEGNEMGPCQIAIKDGVPVYVEIVDPGIVARLRDSLANYAILVDIGGPKVFKGSLFAMGKDGVLIYASPLFGDV